MGQLLIYHMGCSVNAYRARDTIPIRRFGIPSDVFNVHEYIRVVQMLILIRMLCSFPKLYGLGARKGEYSGSGGFSDWRPGATGGRGAYCVFSDVLMLISFLRMVNMAVLNNTLSAYVTTFACSVKA